MSSCEKGRFITVGYHHYVTVFVQGQLLSFLGYHSGAHQAEVRQPAGKSLLLPGSRDSSVVTAPDL